jgi:hypothetical protein
MPTLPSNSDDFEKRINDIIRAETGIIAFCMVALGFLLSAISSFNQTNIGLDQIGLIKLCEYIPLAPTFQYFVFMVTTDIVSLSAILTSKIIPARYRWWREVFVVVCIASLIIGLAFFLSAIWGLVNAFFYYKYSC